jgi:hypothetical protein
LFLVGYTYTLVVHRLPIIRISKQLRKSDMTPALITEIMLNIFSPDGGVKRNAYNENAMADCVIKELAQSWDALPDSTKAIMLGVAYDLKVQSAEMHAAGQATAIVLGRAMQRSRGLQ